MGKNQDLAKGIFANSVTGVTMKTQSIAHTNGTNAINIDSIGNVGIGVTPSAWYATNVKALDIGTNTALWNWAGETRIFNNSYMDSAANYRYKNNGYASFYNMDNSNGSHKWLTAPSGTSGNAITWNTAMTLGANGNLLVGTTTDNGVDKLQVNGTISSSPKITNSGTITGTYTGGVWYQVPNIDGANFNDSNWEANYIVSFFDNSYATGMGNYSNVFTFLTGAIQTTSNAGNIINIQLLSRSGHACNGASMELAWQMTYSSQWPKLMFKLGASSTYTNGGGQYLAFKIRKL